MKKRRANLRKISRAALAAILSLQMALPAAYGTVPTVASGVVLNGTNTIYADGGTIRGNGGTGYFVGSGSLTINNATLTNFATTGGTGSGGGAGMGGALFVNSGATVTLNNVNFTNNTVKGGQGGVGDVGGSLNNLFNAGSTATGGFNGSTPNQTNFTDIGGTTGTKATNGASSVLGFGGTGGNGGNGGNGGDRSESLILGVTAASLDIAALISQVVADSANPFTANVAIGLAAQVASAGINLGNAIAALAYFDKSLADGQIGLGGSGGAGGKGGNSGFGYGGAAGGNGGNGGAGGSNWGGSAFNGGAAGGDAGDGGSGGLGGFGAGGGRGGDGGLGGAGAILSAQAASPGTPAVPDQYITTPYEPAIPYRAAGTGPDGLPSADPQYALEQPYVPEKPGTAVFIQGTPATPAVFARPDSARPNGLDGAGGEGGYGGFGAGGGASGAGPGSLIMGGSGGNGLGGAIFVRSGATLIITGNATFDRNGARGGDGQSAGATTVAGSAGVGSGADLFMMKGSTVILDPGAGNVITFKGSASGASIADDSIASLGAAGGTSNITSGNGAGLTIKSGLVKFDGANLYSGQTKIEGGSLQAQDSVGIYWDSNINFAGTSASNAVLLSNGEFARFTGAQSDRVQWTGSGGFAAAGGELSVNLNPGEELLWGDAGFVTTGHALIFGAEQATDKVTFENSIDLSNGDRTILVKANEGNTDWAIMNGVLSNGSLTVGDALHTGKLVLAAANTYTGSTTINNGTVDLTGSLASSAISLASGTTLNSLGGGLDATAAVTNNGTLNLGATNDTIASLTNTGAINGTGVLTATTYNLNGGSVVKVGLGAGTINTTGTVTLHGSTGAGIVNVALGSILNLAAAEILLDSAIVTVNGTMNLNGGNETINTLLGNGIVNTNAYQLFVTNGGSFQGTLNASNANLNTGTGGTGLVLDGGSTNTQSTTVDNNLTVTNGANLSSNAISVTNGATLNITNGGTLTYQTLNGNGTVNATTFSNPTGSTVGGSLTFTGDYTNNGTFAPGASPGLMNIVGAYTENSTLAIELGGTDGAGVNPSGHDQVRAGGAVTLDATTSALIVQGFNAFTPSLGQSFQIIGNASGDAVRVNGTFSAVTYDADGVAGAGAAVANAAVVFDVNTGLLTATGLNGEGSTYGDLGSTTGQRGAAAALFAAALVGPNQIDTATLAGQFALQLTDAAGGSTDIARWSPEYYGSMSDYAMLGDQVMMRSVQDRVSPLNYATANSSGEDSPSLAPAHMSAYFGYTSSHIDTADNASVNRNDYFVGANLLATEGFVVGLAGSVSEGSISAALGSAESNGFGGMVYGRATIAKDFSFFGSFGMSQQSFDLTRSTVNGTVTADTDANSYVGFAGVQYKGWKLGEVSIAPRLSFTYSNTDVKGFSESGSIDALNVGGYSASRFIGEAGLSALWSTELAGRPFSVEVAASIQQYLTDNKDQMAVNVAALPGVNYPVEFNSTGDTQAVIRANASYQVLKSTSIYGGYEGHYGSQTAHYLKAGLRLDF